MGALPTVVSNALGQQTSFSYRTDTGQKLTTTDPNQQTVTNAYSDPVNRLTSITYPDGGLTSIQYNDTGSQIGFTATEKVTSSLNKQTQVIVDGLGRESETILLSDPSGNTYTLTNYDALGRKYQVYNPTRCNPPSTNCGESTWGVTTYEYDALSREILEIPPDGTSTSDNIKTSYSGNTTTVTDEAGKHRTSTVDALGRLTQVSEGSAGYITDYTYEALGNLICVEQHGGVTGTGCSSSPSNDATSPWRVRRFTYDSLSRLLTAKNPETGTISYGYNADSVRTSKTDARGITITYTPDALHRLTQKTYSDSEPTITYTYDAFVSGANYGEGRRTGMTDSSGSTSWTYDTMGREWSEKKTINSITKSTSMLYYYDGSEEQVTYPAESASQGGHSVVLSFVPNSSGTNTTGDVLSVTDTTNTINYVESLVYAPTGQLTGGTYGKGSSYGGIIQTNSFNSRGQPKTLQDCGISTGCSASTYLLNLTYNYGLGTNDNGNVQGITNGKASSRSQSFQYDALNRLTQATSGTTWGTAFTYDPWGDLYQTNTVSGTGTNPMSVNQSVTQTNGGSANEFTLNGYSYDAGGNVLTDGFGNTSCSGKTYSWNAEEQTSCAYGASYTYDGDGARVEKNGGSSTPTLYWGGMVESDLSGNVTSEYVFVNGRRIARRDVSTGSVYYYFEDMLGSSNVIATSAGSIVCDTDYYPFGGEATPCTSNRYKFTGKERDVESGNDYFGARSYNSIVGRFQSPDWTNQAEPVPYARLGNPQTLNLYAYVANNPESSTDIDGHAWWNTRNFWGFGSDGYDDSPLAQGGSMISITAWALDRGLSPAAVDGAVQAFLVGQVTAPLAQWQNIAGSFNQLWSNYPSHSRADSDPRAANSIWSLVGGPLEAFGKQLQDEGQEVNTCALRMSYALNESGLTIPRQEGTFTGKGGKQYFLSVTALQAFLTKTLGAPQTLKGGSFSGPSGSAGIISFNVSAWRPGATGHFSLWNGSSLIDRSEEGYDRWIRTGALPDNTLFWSVK